MLARPAGLKHESQPQASIKSRLERGVKADRGGSLQQRGAKAVIVGSLTRDRVEVEGRTYQRIGGVVWHAGITLAELGVRTGVVTRIAMRDEDLAVALQSAGVEVTWQPSAQTTTFLNRYPAGDPDRRTQSVLGLAEAIHPEELIGALRDADLALLGPLHPQDLADDIVTAFDHERPSTVAIDVQGYTRVIRNGAITAGVDNRLPDILGVCDAIKASRDEAQLITGSLDAEGSARELAKAYPSREIVVTSGTEGTFIGHRGNVHHEPAVPADIVDPTGAGDIFFAAYLARRLENAPLGAAARFAAAFTALRLARSDGSPPTGH